MFGSRKNRREEQIREIFSEVSAQRSVFETGMSQIEEGEKHIHTELCQITENSVELVNNATLNIEEESALIHTIDDFSRDLKEAIEGYTKLTEAVSKQMVDITNLVEENKHYTSPAKYLTEAPVSLKKSCESYEKQLETLAENSRQMGVMALNAAIEAGHMGESSKKFVTVSEEIHQAAINYEQVTLSLKEEVISSYKKMKEMEDTIHRLVALIKEGNIATTRLFKKCQETEKMIQNSTMRDFSEDVILMRDKVIAMRNLDEEVAKCAERNQIQLKDIQEEVLNQKRELTELESDLSYLFDTAEEQLK